MAWSDLFLRHFTHFFYKPFDVTRYAKDDLVALRLATFDGVRGGYVGRGLVAFSPGLTQGKYRLYASLGLSEHADQVLDVGEIILFADDKGKDIPELFVNFLFFILDRRIPLGSHFAIGGIEKMKPDFSEYFDKQALYVTLANGFPQGFEQVKKDEDIGLVFQGIFISWAEHDFLNRNGWQAFEEKYRAQENVDPCSLRRPSCV